VSYAKGAWTLGVVNYWTPDYFGEVGDADAIEGSVAYAFSGKLFHFFSPTVSGGVGYWDFDELTTDYAYWNAGLTLGFMEHWSADVRYWDTNLSDGECFAFTALSSNLCDARVVGTLKAVFYFSELPQKHFPISRAPLRRPFFFAARVP
jgi:Bacterial protein of unknown function (Gcw_chp)